jgi:hypothetical protein
MYVHRQTDAVKQLDGKELLAPGAGTTAGYAPEARLGPAERREAAGALTRDECLEAGVEQRRLAFEAAEALASRRSVSSMFSVARLCINMLRRCRRVKAREMG